MLRCRRGSIATTFALLAVAICGLAALGTEVGTWYVIKRSAQNAADAGALAGAFALTRINASQSDNVVTSAVDLANQNGFCTGRAQSCTFNGSPQTVTVTQGGYSGGTFTPGSSAAGSPAVQVVITQTQPGIFAALFGLSSIPVQAGAVAIVAYPSPACVLALTGQVYMQGNASINAPGCAIGSNSTAANSVDFGNNGGGSLSVTVGAITTSGGCSGSTTHCGTGTNPPYPVTTYAPPIANPLARLDAVIANAGLDKLSICPSPPTDYGTRHCRNDNVTFKNDSYSLSGTYIFSGSVSIDSNADITGTATLILLPGATLSVGANATVNLTAQNPVPAAQLPATISAGVLDGLLLYDSESGTISSNGNPTLDLNGVVYAPNATWAMKGDSGQTGNCAELIAAAVSFVGNPSYNATGCPSNIALKAQVVQLVQ